MDCIVLDNAKTNAGMKFLKEICHDPDIICEFYKFKKTARAILFNSENKIALQHAINRNWHELPGGRLESRENLITGLKRECCEEVGAEIDVVDTVGMTLEIRNTDQVVKLNHCFVANIVGNLAGRELTDEEIEDGLVLEFHTLEEAIELLSNDAPDTPTGRCHIESELAFLIEYKNKAKNKNF